MNSKPLTQAFNGLDFDCGESSGKQTDKPPPNKALMGVGSGGLPAIGAW